MPLIPKPSYNQVFASQAPEQDKPAVFSNYPGGWGVESRPNNGKPTIKGFNYLQQTSDLKDLWILQNGAALPYDATMEYAENAHVVKDGELQKKQGASWVSVTNKGYNLDYFVSGKSYPLHAEIMLTNGNIVKSTIADNTANPNVDMTGWINALDASFVVDGDQNQKQINLYGAKTHEPGIYPPGSKVIRDDGVIVQSITAGNTVDPNSSMTNWRGFISGRRYIDVADYVSSDDTQDVYAGVKAAFAAAQGREVVFTNPYTGSRTYRFLSRTNGGIIVPDGARVICEGNAVLDFSNWKKSGPRRTLFKVSGTQSGTTHALTSDALIDTKVITLVAGGGAAYNVGDYILITSTAVFGIYSYDTQGEFARIVSKSGDALTLHEALHANYLVSDVSNICKINFASDVAFEGMNIIGAGRFLDDSSGDSGISGELVKGFSVSGSTIDSVDFHAISANRCLNFSITDFDITHVPTLATTGPQYGVAVIGGSMYGEISNGTSRNGRHAVAWTDTGNVRQGISRYVNILNSQGVGQNGASFTTHTNTEHGKIIHCSSTGCAAGADIRVPNMVVDDLTVRSLRPDALTQYGIVLRSKAANLSVSGLKVFGGRFGIASVVAEPLSNPTNIKITDSDFYSQNQRAINLEHTTDTAITGLKISDNYVKSNSGATIRVTIPTKNVNIRDNVVRGLTSNVSESSAIQVTNADAVIAIDNTAIGYAQSVLIQSSTGTHINRGNEVMEL